jgi:hypothetical protein
MDEPRTVRAKKSNKAKASFERNAYSAKHIRLKEALIGSLKLKPAAATATVTRPK